MATLELASLTAGASVCACWSGMGEPCALSRNVCASGAAGEAVELAVPMRMLCGVADSGFLEVEVRPADGAGCADWRLGWSIAE